MKTFNLSLIPLLQVSPLQQTFVIYSTISLRLAKILNNLQKIKDFRKKEIKKAETKRLL